MTFRTVISIRNERSLESSESAQIPYFIQTDTHIVVETDLRALADRHPNSIGNSHGTNRIDKTYETLFSSS